LSPQPVNLKIISPYIKTMRPVEPTQFMNSKRRVIYQSQPKRGSTAKVFFTVRDGKKVYGPKAHFTKNGNNAVRVVTSANTIPSKLAKQRMPSASKGSRSKVPSAPSTMSAANARAFRMGALANKRRMGGLTRGVRSETVRKAARKPRAPRAAKAPNYEMDASKMFAKLLNKKPTVRKPRAAKPRNYEMDAGKMFAKLLNKKPTVRKPRKPSAPRAAKPRNYEMDASKMFAKMLNKRPTVRKPRKPSAPRAAKPRNYEMDASKMFAKMLNKKVSPPKAKPNAPPNMSPANARAFRMGALANKRAAGGLRPKPRVVRTPAMKLLLKINAENRRIISRNKALLKKASASNYEMLATNRFAKMLNKKAPVRKPRKAKA
jgi:hypothetical protein